MPNQATHTNISVDNFPFYLDTGATTHISPSHNDFLLMHPIASRPVCGIGGSLIFTIGIGEIRLRIAHSAWILLQDALFILAATVHLVSVSAIARDSKVVSHFDDTACWLTSKSSGAIIAQGNLFPKTKLYSLSLCCRHESVFHLGFTGLVQLRDRLFQLFVGGKLKD